MAQPPENPRVPIPADDMSQIAWDARLQMQGVPTVIPQERRAKIFKLKGEEIDEKTGLPKETDAMRRTIAQRLALAIKQGESFACLYTDTDNLKNANNIHRNFGDSVIKGDAVVASNIAEEFETENTHVFVTRQTDAADETVVWIFGATTEQLKQLRERTADINKRRKSVKVPYKDDPEYETFLSTTAAVLDSNDPAIHKQVASTKKWLEESEQQGEETLPMNLYQEIKDKVDDETKLRKISKDIARLPIDEIGGAIDRIVVKKILARATSGTRVSEPLQWTALSVMESSTLMDVFTHRQTREMMYQELGMDYERGESLGFSEEDLRVIYYDVLLHRIYDEAGHEME